MESRITCETEHYTFSYTNITYEINQISPLLELKRYKLITDIKESCEAFFKEKKIPTVNVDNVIPRWMMLQFKNSPYYVDPLLPYNASDNSQLIVDIHNLTEKKVSYEEAQVLVIELNLTEKFNNAVNELRNYIKSDFYINNFNNIVISVDDSNNTYLTVIVTINDYEEYNLEALIPYTFRLNRKIIKKLLEKYYYGNTFDNFFKKLITCIIIRYSALFSLNQQAAVIPSMYLELKEKYNVNMELFGSPINSFYENYCSMYYDLESHVHSRGNFFNMNIERGFYVANPPFDETIMKNMSLSLIESLKNGDRNNNELSVFITIPAWDKAEYGEFECLAILQKSGLIRYSNRVAKRDIVFFDYTENSYKNLVDVYFILIQNNAAVVKYPDIEAEMNQIVTMAIESSSVLSPYAAKSGEKKGHKPHGKKLGDETKPRSTRRK